MNIIKQHAYQILKSMLFYYLKDFACIYTIDKHANLIYIKMLHALHHDTGRNNGRRYLVKVIPGECTAKIIDGERTKRI